MQVAQRQSANFTLTTDIKKQLHYETWRKFKQIYNNLKGAPDKVATIQIRTKCQRQKTSKNNRKVSKATRKNIYIEIDIDF